VPRACSLQPQPRATARAALALTLWMCTSAHAETLFDAAADVAYDSNVTRAELRDDIRSDSFATGRAAWSRRESCRHAWQRRSRRRRARRAIRALSAPVVRGARCDRELPAEARRGPHRAVDRRGCGLVA
jgi:hypothetical protein